MQAFGPRDETLAQVLRRGEAPRPAQAAGIGGSVHPALKVVEDKGAGE